ncbi:hypothetical protein [Streptomyces sp. NPDC021212]|uniref:hypothetical protein n=1 Tax=Streptomyces sp. NPDC021212 TaxID=3365118 RepID=UPI0037925230
MGPVLVRHPLHALLAREHTTAATYLKRVADRHQALGYGQMVGPPQGEALPVDRRAPNRK